MKKIPILLSKKDVDEKLVALENQHIIEKNNGLANYYNTISDFQKILL